MLSRLRFWTAAAAPLLTAQTHARVLQHAPRVAAHAALLTGLQPPYAGVRTNVDGNSFGKALKPETRTPGSVFADAGYETARFGKSHLGPHRGEFQTFVEAADEPAV